MKIRPLYERAYEAAHMHWRSAGILDSYSTQNREATVMPSYCVLASFATELYLKTLFYIEIEAKTQSAKLQEHSLAYLYHTLSPDSRDAVRSYFDMLLPRYRTFGSNFPPNAAPLLEANAFTTDLDTTLTMTSDAFLNFRYWYQKASNIPYPSAAQVLRHAVNRRILDLVPHLKENQKSASLIDTPLNLSAQQTNLVLYESDEFPVHPALHTQAYFAAQSTWRASQVLYAKLHEGAHFVLYSYAMLAGLSSELCLKALLHLEDSGRGITHPRSFKIKSLSRLYQMLTHQTRIAIRKHFNTLARKIDPLPLPESIPQDVRALARNKVISYDFDSTLRTMSEAFADFRYAFEHPHFLVVLPTDEVLWEALKRRFLELMPNLGNQRT